MDDILELLTQTNTKDVSIKEANISLKHFDIKKRNSVG